MNMFLQKFPTKRFCVGLLCSALGAASYAQNPNQVEELPLPFEEVRIFAEALDNIRSSYVREIDDKTLLEYAIKGMLGIDDHQPHRRLAGAARWHPAW